MTSFWSSLQKTRTFVPAIPDAGRKNGKMKRKKKRKMKKKRKEEEDIRKTTYLHGGALVESFSP